MIQAQSCLKYEKKIFKAWPKIEDYQIWNFENSLKVRRQSKSDFKFRGNGYRKLGGSREKGIMS